MWLLLLLLPTVQAAPQVAILVHHPTPDDADPLGVSLEGADSFMQRFSRFDEDNNGFDFPTLVADGQMIQEGLPEGDPQEATNAAYIDMVERRLSVETPIDMEARAIVLNGTLRVVVKMQSTADLSGESLNVWLAVVEQPVHYEPPAALSNGVFEHPFTLRHIDNLGPVTLPHEVRHVMPWNDDWETSRIHVAVWVQQTGAFGTGLEPGEVAQAVFHKLGDEVTQTSGRTVLLEAYSATWCDPCLFGDRAVEEVAAAYGVASAAPTADEATYWRAPPAWVWPVIATAAVAMFVIRLPEDE